MVDLPNLNVAIFHSYVSFCLLMAIYSWFTLTMVIFHVFLMILYTRGYLQQLQARPRDPRDRQDQRKGSRSSRDRRVGRRSVAI